MLKFSAGLQLFFIGLVFGLFYTPLRLLIFEDIMGLTLELSEYITPGAKLMFLMAIFWGSSTVFRGMLAAIRSTTTLAATAGIRLIVIAIVCSTTLFFPYLNGSIVGVLALSSALMTESLILGWLLYLKLKNLDDRLAPLAS